jgi:AraC-like DNA-binding protein
MKMEQYQKMYLYMRIVQAKLFIDDHYFENIDLSNIADEACFSKFHFIRLFKTIYGKTPHHYLTQVRIEKAKLLLSKGLPISDTSISVGFDSSTSFAALFKKYSGVSPSVFQSRELSKKSIINANPFQVIPNCFAQTHGWTKKQFRIAGDHN